MAEQAEGTQTSHIPQRAFFERYCALSIYVLLAESLDDTQLKDPESGETIPNARQSYSAHGLCYARDILFISNGNYRATVAASPDMVGAEQIVLEEEQLKFALAWHEGMRWMNPSSIRRLARAHGRELAPLRSCAKSVPAADPFPAPLVDLCANQDKARQLCAAEVTEDDLREAVPPGSPDVQSADVSPTEGSRSRMHIKPVDPSTFQQALLRTMLKTLQRQLAQTCEQARALELKAQCTLVAHLRYWQRRTHQRVVHVEERRWCAVRKCWVWDLTLKAPQSMLAESAAQVAAA